VACCGTNLHLNSVSHPTGFLSVIDRPLSLNCLLLGDDPSRGITIEIQATKTVAILKEAIWKKKLNRFKHVDADTLILWKVSIPTDGNLAQKLAEFDAVEKELLEKPSTKLLNAFPEPLEDEHIHIIVRRPDGESVICSLYH
jgi:Crinkler effector protein N-terminal domain